MKYHIEKLLKKYDIISEQVERRELEVILRECKQALLSAPMSHVSIVEFGCYEGTTSLFLQRLVQEIQPQVSLHVYDSFAGLPQKTTYDASGAGEHFKPGELYASKQSFVQNFKKAQLPLPVIHKGWFYETRSEMVPGNICFAFLDGDYYESITDSLRLIWTKLLPGAVIVVDDYQNEALPGAQRAVDDWLRTHPAKLRVEASLAIIRLIQHP